MNSWKTVTLTMVTSLSLVAVLGGTYAAAPPHSTSETTSNFWSTVANTLHLPTATVTNAVKQAEIAQWTRMATGHHRSTEAIQKRIAAITAGTLTRPKIRHASLRTPNVRHMVHLTDQVLQVKTSSVMQALRQGETLDQIAQAHQMSGTAFQAQVIARLEKPLQTREQAGKLTASRVSRRERRMTHRVNHLSNQTLTGWAQRASSHSSLWQSTAAQYLGMSSTALLAALHHGQSLSALVAAESTSGKSVAGLTAVLDGAYAAQIQSVETAHHLSTVKVQRLETRWSKRMTTLLTKTF